MPDQVVRISTWTNRFLGTEATGKALLKLLETTDDGRWIPDRWNFFEPIRNRYVPGLQDEILSGWIEQRPRGSAEVTNLLLFRKRSPSELTMAKNWRARVPRLNSIWLELSAKPFLTSDGSERLKKMLLDFIAWSRAIYGSVHSSVQAHKRMAQMTPLERLERMNWLNFFGLPYVEMFGREKLLNAPCYSVEEIPGRGILLMSAPRCDSPEITESADKLIALEEYLGAKAFAGCGYPEVPCDVPTFDLSETVIERASLEPPQLPGGLTFPSAQIYFSGTFSSERLSSLKEEIARDLGLVSTLIESRDSDTTVTQIRVDTETPLTVQFEGEYGTEDELNRLLERVSDQLGSEEKARLATSALRLDIASARLTQPKFVEGKILVVANTDLDPRSADVQNLVNYLSHKLDGWIFDCVNGTLKDPRSGHTLKV